MMTNPNEAIVVDLSKRQTSQTALTVSNYGPAECVVRLKLNKNATNTTQTQTQSYKSTLHIPNPSV